MPSKANKETNKLDERNFELKEFCIFTLLFQHAFHQISSRLFEFVNDLFEVVSTLFVAVEHIEA